MRVAFTKPPYDVNLSWQSQRFPGAKELLDTFVFRSLGFCMAVELKADIWIVEWESVKPSTFQNPDARRDDPGAPMRVYNTHKGIVKENEVPWDEYDVVVAYWPSISRKVIESHPDILWCYREIQPRCRRSKIAGETGRAFGAWDLYLDYYFTPSRHLHKLPQSVWFPFLQNPDLMRKLIRPKHKPAVFIESRHVLRDKTAMSVMRAKFQRICGLPIHYSPISGARSEPIKFNQELTKAKIVRTAEYLQRLGECKYFLIWRGARRGESKIVGQSALEAAALGLIVVGNDNSIYHKMLCHPYCLIPPGGPSRIGLRKIQRIEKDGGFQRKILEHQARVVRKMFWQRPLATLRSALEMKRGIA